MPRAIAAGPRPAQGPNPAPLPVSDRVYREILASVRSCRYRAGERLTEARLATELQVSRVPLREVLKRLAAEGVLELHPNRGAAVRVITRRDISELFQVRAALEGYASRLAATRINEDDNRDHFSTLLEATRAPYPDNSPLAFVEHDEQVHGGIVRRCGNGLLVRHWTLLQHPLHRLRHFTDSRTWDADSSLDDHERILTAVVAGDGDAAAAEIGTHLQRVLAQLMTLSQAEFDSVFNPGLTPLDPCGT